MEGLALVLALGSVAACESSPAREARPAAVERTPPEAAEAPEPQGAEASRAVPAATRSPASLEVLSTEHRKQFEAAVAEGRQLHHDGDYDRAIAAYRRGLELLPGDPRTLSELGWAALFAGRLEEAEDVLRRAEAGVADDPRLLASILYNLGRVAEARGEPADAVKLYQRSLRLRPHSDTFRHLSGLPGGTRYEFGPRVRPLQGPYARLGEFCQQERRLTAHQRADELDDSFGCITDAAKGLGGRAVEVPRSRSLGPPWKALRFVETRPTPYSVRFHAALRTEAGWFILPDVASLSRGVPGTTERVTRLAAQAEELFGGDADEVTLEVETRWVATEGGRELESETHRVEFLCGLGASGTPSCTGALPRATQARRREAGGVEQTRWAIRRRALPEGVVVLDGDPSELDEPAAAILGPHRIEFP